MYSIQFFVLESTYEAKYFAIVLLNTSDVLFAWGRYAVVVLCLICKSLHNSLHNLLQNSNP